MDGILPSEFVTDLIIGSFIFFITLFLFLLINKGLKKTVNWSGLGSIDTIFGFLFGAIKGYIYFITIFTVINLAHPYKDGMILLIKVLPLKLYFGVMNL